MHPLFFTNRIAALLLAWWVVIGCYFWMRQNPTRKWYMFPVLTGALHIGIFYSVYLLTFSTEKFSLQFFADWGSLVLSHIVTMAALIVLDLLFGIFSRRLGRWFFTLLVAAAPWTN